MLIGKCFSMVQRCFFYFKGIRNPRRVDLNFLDFAGGGEKYLRYVENYQSTRRQRQETWIFTNSAVRTSSVAWDVISHYLCGLLINVFTLIINLESHFENTHIRKLKGGPRLFIAFCFQVQWHSSCIVPVSCRVVSCRVVSCPCLAALGIDCEVRFTYSRFSSPSQWQ